jgi:hypothetical protein
MDTAPLTLFARKVSASNHLLFADLRRLRRDILPEGITTREEAEVLLGAVAVASGRYATRPNQRMMGRPYCCVKPVSSG